MVNRVVAHPSPRNHNRKTQFLLYQCDHEFNCPRTDKSSVEHPEKQYDQLKTKKNIQPTLLSPLSSKIPSSRLSPCLPRFAHEPQPQPSWLNATRRLSPIIFLSAKKKKSLPPRKIHILNTTNKNTINRNRYDRNSRRWGSNPRP